MKLEVQTLAKIKSRINEKVMSCHGTWIDWQYLLDAAALLAKCWYTLQYTYPYAYCKVYRHLANKAAASSKYCQSIQVPWQLITFSLIRLLILASVCASSFILFE